MYVLSHVLHDWADKEAAAILVQVRKVIPASGVVLLREGVVPEGDAPSPVKMADVNMLLITGGAVRTEAEWRALLGRTGFTIAKIHAIPGPMSLIEAKPV